MMKFRKKLRARDAYGRDAIEQLKQHKNVIKSDLSKTNRRRLIDVLQYDIYIAVNCYCIKMDFCIVFLIVFNLFFFFLFFHTWLQQQALITPRMSL